MKKILCFSRSYLSKLFPTIAGQDGERDYYHIVQNNAEEKRIKQLGGQVILNLQKVVKASLTSNQASAEWLEPPNFREITGFAWSPFYADRYLSHLPDSLRLKVAGAIYNALQELFANHQFDYFLSEPVALFTTHLLLYFCKCNNTEVRLWVNSYFPNHFYFASSLDYSVPHQRKEPSENAEELRGLIETYCKKVVADKAGPVYHFSFSTDLAKNLNYFKQRVGSASLVLLPSFKTLLFQMVRSSRALVYSYLFPKFGDFQTAASVKEHAFYLKCLLTPKRYYDPLPKTVEENKDILTYTLQYEPEASLLYAAPDFYNQISFVEYILRALAPHQVLYIKEHPNQFGALGNKAWRLLRKKYHNVRYIYGRESIRSLIKMSTAVITVSSTAGMDAVLLGKPVIVAGRAFYGNYPNVIALKSYKELPEALSSPQLGAEKQEALSQTVEKLMDMAANSYIGDPQPSAYLYEEKNIKHLVDAIALECV